MRTKLERKALAKRKRERKQAERAWQRAKAARERTRRERVLGYLRFDGSVQWGGA